MKKGTILSIDDDHDLQSVTSDYLTDDGYDVVNAYDVKTALTLSKTSNPDVILLDLTLPDGEGLQLIPQFKSTQNSGIIVVSGKDNTTEKIICLEMGADDYITKPFELRELSARIKAVIRRIEENATSSASNDQIEKITFDNGWCLDQAQYQLFDDKGQSKELTSGEFDLLKALASAPNRVLTRDHLFDITRKGNFDAYDRSIDVQVARLRKKIENGGENTLCIKTVRGVGYMFSGTSNKN